MNTTKRKELLDQFMTATTADVTTSTRFLQACSWNISVAVNRYFENPDPKHLINNVNGLSDADSNALFLDIFGMTKEELESNKFKEQPISQTIYQKPKLSYFYLFCLCFF